MSRQEEIYKAVEVLRDAISEGLLVEKRFGEDKQVRILAIDNHRAYSLISKDTDCGCGGGYILQLEFGVGVVDKAEVIQKQIDHKRMQLSKAQADCERTSTARSDIQKQLLELQAQLEKVKEG